MSKARSKTKLIIVAIFTIIGLLLTFVSFVVPTTNTTFKGFFNAINFGYDIGGGRLSVFEVAESDASSTNLDTELNETVRRLQANFASQGFNVTRQNQTVRIEVSHYDDLKLTTILSQAGASFDLQNLIGGSDGLSFNDSSSDFDAEGSISEKYVKSCKTLPSVVSDGRDNFPVLIEFTEEGQVLFKELTQKITDNSGSLYMHINGKVYNSSGFSLQGAVSNLTLYSTSQTSAQALMHQVNALAKPLRLSIIVDDVVTAGLNTGTGNVFGNIQFMLCAALIAVFVASVICLLVRYRMLGVIATVAMLLFVSIYAFFLQSIPLILLDINGLMGVLLSFALLFFTIRTIFEGVREEYAVGKRIPNSVSSAFRKSIINTLEKSIFLLLFAAVLFIVGTVAFQAFAAALFVGLIVNFFVVFVALRGMCLSYTVVNSTKRTYYNLKREEVRDEI